MSSGILSEILIENRVEIVDGRRWFDYSLRRLGWQGVGTRICAGSLSRKHDARLRRPNLLAGLRRVLAFGTVASQKGQVSVGTATPPCEPSYLWR
jgi:hypothetical protein